MYLWYVILVIVNANGEARAVAHYPKSPSYNNERNCLEYGQELSEKVQVELGTKNARVFWKCESVSYDTIAKSLPRT
jgi:hypothetical protein